MSVEPASVAIPQHPLTVADYLALGKTEVGYTELVEGRLILSPSPTPEHSTFNTELWLCLRQQLPRHLVAVVDVDVDLLLNPPNRPGYVRRPDLIVVSRDAVRRVRRFGGLLTARDVVLTAEIISPSSRRTDRDHKRGEYADAGIPHYWILDTTAPVSLLACHLTDELGYVDAGEVTGAFRTTVPFSIEIDLNSLVEDELDGG